VATDVSGVYMSFQLEPQLLMFIAIAIIIGGLVGYLLGVRRLKNIVQESKNEQMDIEVRYARFEAEHRVTQDECNRLQIENKRLSDAAQVVKEAEQKARLVANQLQVRLEEKEIQYNDQLTVLKADREQLKREFEQLATEILDRKGKDLKALSEESLSNLLKPFHGDIKGFKETVERMHHRDTEQRVELRTELKHLQGLNREITDQASRLANALQGQKKVQGNWGELMLENVLDSSGLRLGTDYKREVSIDTEEGRLRPDAIVYLPQGQHIVIDAKTSLAAYTRFVNADTDEERGVAIAEHTMAVSDRINELSSKDYGTLPGLNSPEVVIMFVPIESAYVEALKHDETLFQKALEKNVLVATPTTLLTSLNIVRQLWRFEDQNKHTAELANRAEKFYKKLNSFLTSMQQVGSQLDRAKDTYIKAFDQLYSGRGNLIKQAAEFKELGVAVQKELPADLVDRANLELGEAIADAEPVTSDA